MFELNPGVLVFLEVISRVWVAKRREDRVVVSMGSGFTLRPGCDMFWWG